MAGASGYVLKDLDPSRLQDSIITVGRGGSLLDRLRRREPGPRGA